jgi:hypothetical protein
MLGRAVITERQLRVHGLAKKQRGGNNQVFNSGFLHKM